MLGKLIEEGARQITAPVVPVHLTARECYEHAIGQGWAALDATACEEVLQLAAALMSLTNAPQSTSGSDGHDSTESAQTVETT